MHCAICDKDDDIVSIYPNDLCSQCQAVIQEILEEFEGPETESTTELDYASSGREHSLHGSGVEPGSSSRRPFCEAYNLSTEA